MKNFFKRFNFFPLISSLLSIFCLFILVSFFKTQGYAVTYQPTASMPRGFYLIVPIKKIERGDLVVFFPPESIKKILLAKHLIPDSGLLMKYVYGLPGDLVCVKQRMLWLNHCPVAKVLHLKIDNESLSAAAFCGKLIENQYLLLSPNNLRSFDSRYFGPVKQMAIVGKAKLLF
jgi:conjugative transfer signal peptidase TraF